MGKLVPSGMTYRKMELIDNDKVIAEFEKTGNSKAELIGRVNTFRNVSEMELKVILGGILFWQLEVPKA